jgi:hypothetical protein
MSKCIIFLFLESMYCCLATERPAFFPLLFKSRCTEFCRSCVLTRQELTESEVSTNNTTFSYCLCRVLWTDLRSAPRNVRFCVLCTLLLICCYMFWRRELTPVLTHTAPKQFYSDHAVTVHVKCPLCKPVLLLYVEATLVISPRMAVAPKHVGGNS